VTDFSCSVNHDTPAFPPFTNYGFNLRFTLAVEESVPDGEARIEALERLWDNVRAELQLAGEDATRFARRSKDLTPVFKPGDLIWLSRSNLSTARPSAKLDYRKDGPFEVVEPVGKRVDHLNLPEHMQLIYPVFHVSVTAGTML